VSEDVNGGHLTKARWMEPNLLNYASDHSGLARLTCESAGLLGSLNDRSAQENNSFTTHVVTEHPFGAPMS
jgi:hypothetical protein